MTNQPTKADLLNLLERETMNIAGEVVLSKVGYTPRLDRIETSLGEIITAILELKKMEGVPTNLQLVDGKESVSEG